MTIAKINGTNYAVKTFQNIPVLTLKDIDHFHDYMDGTTRKMFARSKSVMAENEDFFVVSRKELGTDFITVYKLGTSETTGILVALTGYLMLCKSMTDKRSFEISKTLIREYFRTDSPRMSEEQMQPFMDVVRAIRNENHYLLGMMERMQSEFTEVRKLLTPKIQETIAISDIQEWSDKTFAKVREISRSKCVYDRDVIRDICKAEEFKGIDFTVLKEEYTKRTGQRNPYLLKVVAATIEERKIFEKVLDRMYKETFEKEEIPAVCVPQFTTMSIPEIIRPLIAKRGDKNPTATPTYRIVYKTMNIDWDKELESYALKHGLSKLPRKMTLVEEIPSIRDEFKNAVEKLLQ